MPRIRTIPPEEATGELAEVYGRIGDVGFPVVPTVFQLASLRPDLLRVLIDAYGTMFYAGRLPRETKEAIATWVSVVNRCPYCTDAHSAGLRLAGATEEQVAAARTGDADAFADDEATRRFLRLADKITRNAYKVVDEDVDGLREAGWDDEQVLEAVFVAAAFNLINRLADTLGATAEDMAADMARIGRALSD